MVFGAAIGPSMGSVSGVSYGAFIVPGLVMLAIFTESIANASFGIYFPKFTGTIYELLSAPVSPFEIVLAYVGAATSKSILLGVIIMATAAFFVNAAAHDYRVAPGSPAIEAGVSITSVAKDRIGVSRPQGAYWDVGAYEYVH